MRSVFERCIAMSMVMLLYVQMALSFRLNMCDRERSVGKDFFTRRLYAALGTRVLRYSSNCGGFWLFRYRGCRSRSRKALVFRFPCFVSDFPGGRIAPTGLTSSAYM